MSEYTLLIRMKIHRHLIDDFVDAMREITEETVREDGCLAFETRQDPDQDDVYYVFESFSDEQSWIVHRDASYHVDRFPRLHAAIAEIDMKELKPVGFSMERMRQNFRGSKSA